MALCTLLSFALIGCVLSAPHHHFHKTVYIGGEGGGVADSKVAGGGGLSFSASIGAGGLAKHEVVSEKVIDVEVPPQPEIKAHKTVIERTVVPQYVEKTIQVPTYVEKTIRVPTYVAKRVRVPIEPTVVEKTISQEHVPASEVKVAKSHSYDREIVSGHGGGGGYAVAGATHGGGFFDSIFNIPVQTLGAVNGLLNNLSGGGHGGGGGGFVGAGFSKGYAAY